MPLASLAVLSRAAFCVFGYSTQHARQPRLAAVNILLTDLRLQRELVMTDAPDDRPILSAYAVKDGDKIVFIHLERAVAEGIADPTSTYPNRRVVEIWIREKRPLNPPSKTL